MNAPWPPPNSGPSSETLSRTRRHQTQQFAGGFADLLHGAAERGGLLAGNGRGPADVGQKNHVAHFHKRFLHHRVQFRHRQRGPREVLRIAVPSQDVGAGVVDRPMAGDQDVHGVVPARARFQEGLEGAAQGGRGGLLVRQHQHLVRRNAASARAGQMPAEGLGVRIRILEP